VADETIKAKDYRYSQTHINQLELEQKPPRNFTNNPTNFLSPTIITNNPINSNPNITNNSANNNNTTNTSAQFNFPASFAQEAEQNPLENSIVNLTAH
jgi:hypothetical protein